MNKITDFKTLIHNEIHVPNYMIRYCMLARRYRVLQLLKRNLNERF